MNLQFQYMKLGAWNFTFRCVEFPYVYKIISFKLVATRKVEFVIITSRPGVNQGGGWILFGKHNLISLTWRQFPTHTLTNGLQVVAYYHKPMFINKVFM